MTENAFHGSATIYQFPLRPRSVGGFRREDATSAANNGSRAADVAVTGAWYHDAAIEESKPVREH